MLRKIFIYFVFDISNFSVFKLFVLITVYTKFENEAFCDIVLRKEIRKKNGKILIHRKNNVKHGKGF